MFWEDEDWSLLIREWVYYPDVLLEPSTVSTYDGYRKYVNIGSEPTIQHGTGTYHLTLLLPEEEETYSLSLPEIFSAYRLFINDELVLQKGDPTPETYVEEISNETVIFSASGQTNLLIATNGQSSISSGMVYPPAFGNAEDVFDVQLIRLFLHGFWILGSILLGLLSLTFGMKGDKTKGFLGVILALCIIGITGYPLLHEWWITSYSLWYTVEAISHYALLFLAILLFCNLREIPSRRAFLLATPCGIGILLSLIYWQNNGSLHANATALFSTISFALKGYTALCLIALSIKGVSQTKAPSSLPLLGTLAFSTCLIWDRIFPMYEPIYGGWFNEIGGILLATSLACTLWLDAVSAYRFRLSYSENLNRMESRLELEKNHYRELHHQIQKARETAHDVRHHIRVLRSMANHGEYNQLSAYLDAYEPYIMEHQVQVWSEHPTADAVLSQYASKAKSLGATFDVRLVLPQEFAFPDDELCVILSNLLENATDAIKEQASGEKKIHMRGEISNHRLYILMENTFDGIVVQHDDHYLSKKHAGLGLGLSSIASIATQRGGLTDFNATENCFTSSVMIPLD